jgi:hypothetical protein
VLHHLLSLRQAICSKIVRQLAKGFALDIPHLSARTR